MLYVSEIRNMFRWLIGNHLCGPVIIVVGLVLGHDTRHFIHHIRNDMGEDINVQYLKLIYYFRIITLFVSI